MTQLISLCVDGSGAKGEIRKALKDAYAKCEVPMKTGTSKYSKSANVGMSDYRRKIRDLAKNNGDNPGALNLLIVGKSLGGAKMYRFLYKQSEYLKQFAS